MPKTNLSATSFSTKLFTTLLFFLPFIGVNAQTRFICKGTQMTTNKHIILVDASKKNKPKSYTFSTINEALRCAERNANDGEWTNIYISPSVYWIDNPDDPSVRVPLEGEHEPYGIKLSLNQTRLIGLSNNPEDVVLASSRGQTQGAVGNFTMLGIKGNDIEAENITFGNYCNVDLVYPLNPKLNRKRRADAIVQAQLAICHGDRYTIRNCRFISRLNLCPLVGPSHVDFYNCYFECTDDALCGTGTYNDCRFTFYSSKPFYTTSRKGAVFNNCDIHTKTRGTQYLTKVSGPVALNNCRWTSEDPDLKIEWTRKPNPKDLCLMNGCTLNGKPLIVPPTPMVPMPVGHPTVPLAAQRSIIPGKWTFDCYKPLDTAEFDWSPDTIHAPWCYGEGMDGAEECYGMMQNVRGARMMYTAPADTYKSQTLTLELNPCKSAGQGFGSATGQYLDVCLKFDTQTLTGYGIRFIRTPSHDHAVTVYLVSYSNGVVKPISEEQVCHLFRKGCHLTISSIGNTLKAIISNTDIPDETDQTLTADITAYANNFGGIHIQHTGSTGASATVISSIHSNYN